MPAVAELGHVGIYTHDLLIMRVFHSRIMGLDITDEETQERGIVLMCSRPEEEHHEFVLIEGNGCTRGVKNGSTDFILG